MLRYYNGFGDFFSMHLFAKCTMPKTSHYATQSSDTIFIEIIVSQEQIHLVKYRLTCLKMMETSYNFPVRIILCTNSVKFNCGR